MENPAPTDHSIHPLLASRWSPRAFEDREISAGALNSMLEAARWAPSCFNEQPWRFIVARRRDGEEFERMLGCLVEVNQSWAKHAQVLMITVARMTFEHNGKPNRHAYHDLGLAVGNLSAQATELGVSLHQMAGFDAQRSHSVIPAMPIRFPTVCATGRKRRASESRSRRSCSRGAGTGRSGSEDPPVRPAARPSNYGQSGVPTSRSRPSACVQSVS